MQFCITAQKLSAGYNNISVFRDFDIEIPEGKITTLIGANGSGKSTILKAMSRLLAPSGGEVYLEGKNIHKMPAKQVAQRLALLPQETQTPSGITVRDLVEYGRFPHRSGLSGLTARDEEIIQWALDCSNMMELAERNVEQLSGGQRQRAFIAMALAQKTGILFLDEPTTYLDISHQLEILQLLRQLNIQQGLTVVMVLHDLNHAIMFSDYLVTIKDGKKYSSGVPQEIITSKMLQDVFKVEAEVIQHPKLDVPVFLPWGVHGKAFSGAGIKKNER